MKSRILIAKRLVRIARQLVAAAGASGIKSLSDIDSFDMINEENFEDIWQLLEPTVKGIANRILGKQGVSADREDAVEYAKLCLLGSIRKGTFLNKPIDDAYGAGGIERYLKTSIGNSIRNFKRDMIHEMDGAGWQLQDVDEYADKKGLVDDKLSRRETLVDALKSMMDNPRDQKKAKAIYLFYCKGYSAGEIGAQIGASALQVNQLVFKAKHQLAELIERDARRLNDRRASIGIDADAELDRILNDPSFWQEAEKKCGFGFMQ